ncbi:hypothetical protein FA95DRAFT_1679979 [Auriscalpium vulgare]|uniref:Uncharacterized protein n=1 Tax=Auriscalpium vulgare TaxID=40419 RepID=A0ACB8RRD2_9AGAM|nr:hypothetical protein FA95DRAFT_1679979 [Auriscalpium vulgare]
MAAALILLGLLIAVRYPDVRAVAVQDQSVSAPQCTIDPEIWSWSTNTIGQEPCIVSAHIEAVCQNNQFVIPPILANQHYTGPNASQSHDLCQCSTVVYCLISACTCCQGGNWTTWQEWSSNCATKLNGTLGQTSIPEGVNVPFWAFQGIAPDERWDNATARGVGGIPEANSTWQPATNTAAPGNNNRKVSLIAGLVSGILGALLIGLLGWLLLRHLRRRKQSTRAAGLAEQFEPKMAARDYSAMPSPSTPGFSPSVGTHNAMYGGSSVDTKTEPTVYKGLPELH